MIESLSPIDMHVVCSCIVNSAARTFGFSVCTKISVLEKFSYSSVPYKIKYLFME